MPAKKEIPGGQDQGDGRTEIPLRMLTGNMAVLLEGPLPVTSVQLKRDPASPFGVILCITQTAEQKAKGRAMGFKTTKLGEND